MDLHATEHQVETDEIIHRNGVLYHLFTAAVDFFPPLFYDLNLAKLSHFLFCQFYSYSIEM